MKKVIHWQDQSGQLCCDNPVCKHVLAPGTVEWGPHLVGYPCPQCGVSMLTESDFRDHERLIRRIKRRIGIINILFGWCFGTEEPDWNRADKIRLRAHNGQVEVKTEPA